MVYHDPAYSSGGNRDNRKLRETWTPLFDKHHVDLALQGHDHAYRLVYRAYDIDSKLRDELVIEK